MARRLAVAAAATAAAALLALGVACTVVAASATLQLNPSQGPQRTPFTATFTYVTDPGVACPTATVDFVWDGTHPLGSVALQPRTGCNAVLSNASPPAADDAPGKSYTVTGTFRDASGRLVSASATFTVTNPTPSPSPTAAATLTPPGTATPTAIATPTPPAAETPATTPTPELSPTTAGESGAPLPSSPSPTATLPLGGTGPLAGGRPAPPEPGGRDWGPWFGLVIGGGALLLLAVVGLRLVPRGRGQHRDASTSPRRRMRTMFAYPTENAPEPRDFLSGLHEDEIATVTAQVRARRYRAGEPAIRRGDSDRRLFVVTTGSFRVAGPSAQVVVLTAGDIFGELAFFDGHPRGADVVAVEDSEVLVVTHADLDRLRLHEPRLAHLVLMDLARIVCERRRDQPPRAATDVL